MNTKISQPDNLIIHRVHFTRVHLFELDRYSSESVIEKASCLESISKTIHLRKTGI